MNEFSGGPQPIEEVGAACTATEWSDEADAIWSGRKPECPVSMDGAAAVQPLDRLLRADGCG